MELELQGVDLAYDGETVVHGVDLALAGGEIGCLLGPSGSGKTSVLRAIAGLEPLQRGVIQVGGHRLSTVAQVVPPEQRGVGMVFQDLALLGHLDVLGNVELGLHRLPRQERRERAREWLQRVELEGRERAYPHQLSGGQQQRVALARALAPQPRVLLLDEPFSALDARLREQLVPEIRGLLKRLGMTALLVTHSQLEAFAFADRIGVMHAGVLQQWGSPYQLYHRPANRFVAHFIGEGVLLPARRERDRIDLPGLGPLQSAGAQGALDVLLRPDDVVHDDASPVQAEVLARHFRGAEFLYRLRLDSGAVVLALVPSHHDHAIGSRIGVRLDAEHVITFAPTAS
jgi:iron(III) transport system ATP-binding protein